MAVYLVSGRLGAGKTLACVGRIRDALREGRRVATNLDLDLVALLGPRAGRRGAVSCVRLPDKPSVADLEALGCGNGSMDETRNGVIVLDELGAWLNAREWADKGRQAVIDWLLHSRKHGWDVMFIAQHLDQVDKQVRTALVEYHVLCRRLDRMRIPFVGGLVRLLSGGWLRGNMPQVHVAVARYGTAQGSPVAERWLYQGRALYAAYNTRQVFREDSGQGVFSYLSPWLVAGRYSRPVWYAWWRGLRAWWRGPVRRVPLREPLPAVALLRKLPADRRMRLWRLLDAAGQIG